MEKIPFVLEMSYLIGENWFVVENVLMEMIPFVLEMKLLELANPFGLECVFYFFFNHDGLFVGFRDSINAAVQPQDKN